MITILLVHKKIKRHIDNFPEMCKYLLFYKNIEMFHIIAIYVGILNSQIYLSKFSYNYDVI